MLHARVAAQLCGLFRVTMCVDCALLIRLTLPQRHSDDQAHVGQTITMERLNVGEYAHPQKLTMLA